MRARELVASGRQAHQRRPRSARRLHPVPAVGHPHRVRVLLIDDSAPFRSVAQELLERRGYLVAAEAGCADEAMDAAALVAPDAVLSDIHLPDQNGFDLTTRLIRVHPALAVLLTSADYNESFHARAAQSGARGFVAKSQLARIELPRFWPAPG